MTRLYRPAPPHNGLLAPAMCMCVECCRKVLALRCPVEDGRGNQCGNYRGHIPRNEHSLLVSTAFCIAEERIRLDA